MYLRVEDLLHQMRTNAQTPPVQLRRRKYMNVALLIDNEIGFEALSREEFSLFFRMVCHLYPHWGIFALMTPQPHLALRFSVS